MWRRGSSLCTGEPKAPLLRPSAKGGGVCEVRGDAAHEPGSGSAGHEAPYP